MSKAKEHNLSVIILNPNQTSYTDDENIANNKEKPSPEDLSSFYLSSDPLPRSSSKPVPGLSSSREHVLYVYDNIIKKYSPAKHFYFVAHSAGGDSLMYLLRQRQDCLLSKPTKIAFTDSIHSISPSDTNDLKTFLKSNAIHFVASDQPMGQAIDSKHHFSPKPACQEVSAGHSKHEYTSGYCINGVFDYFFPPSSNIDKIK
jgi:hypothetical protein